MKLAHIALALLLVPFAVGHAETEGLQIHGIEVAEIVTSTGVTDRQPVGSAETFSPDVGTVYCFTRIKGGGTGSTITHVWYRGAEEKARVELSVRSDSWRTWSTKKIPASWAGEWKVVVLDAGGREIGSTAFTIGG